jgi:hypothetical protein
MRAGIDHLPAATCFRMDPHESVQFISSAGAATFYGAISYAIGNLQYYLR